jgi:hypothetical protein
MGRKGWKVCKETAQVAVDRTSTEAHANVVAASPAEELKHFGGCDQRSCFRVVFFWLSVARRLCGVLELPCGSLRLGMEGLFDRSKLLGGKNAVHGAGRDQAAHVPQQIAVVGRLRVCKEKNSRDVVHSGTQEHLGEVLTPILSAVLSGNIDLAKLETGHVRRENNGTASARPHDTNQQRVATGTAENAAHPRHMLYRVSEEYQLQGLVRRVIVHRHLLLDGVHQRRRRADLDILVIGASRFEKVSEQQAVPRLHASAGPAGGRWRHVSDFRGQQIVKVLPVVSVVSAVQVGE